MKRASSTADKEKGTPPRPFSADSAGGAACARRDILRLRYAYASGTARG